MSGKRFLSPMIVFIVMSLFKDGTTLSLPLRGNGSFVQTSGTQFVVNGKPLYFNGFNACWLMYMASSPSTMVEVSDTFRQASENGMNVVRTWAFGDGGIDNPLQYSPGNYNENMFKGLDFVVSEAKTYGLWLILSFVNYWDDFGGKNRYNQWARDAGETVNSDDEFYSNPLVKQYYKNHVEAILTRVNSISGVTYKDDPTILAWELMNEPRCQSNVSEASLQAWIIEMATHVKSIDANHLLEVGLEGFYGETMPGRKLYNPNPGYDVGTDFISNNQPSGIDFATTHLWPDRWFFPVPREEVQAEFVERWIDAHIEDAKSVLRKPLLITEFGKASSVEMRDNYFETVFNKVYQCAKNGGPCSGAMFWQLMARGMERTGDGYDVFLQQNPSTANVIAQQSRHLSSLPA